MQITYLCSECMRQARKLDVPNRQELADIPQWMKIVMVCITYDHSVLTPECKAEGNVNIAIPYDDQGIGIAGDSIL